MVVTWADAFGNWHARVPRGEPGDHYELAFNAIWGQIEFRSVAHVDAFNVRMRSETDEYTEWTEVWDSDAYDDRPLKRYGSG